MNNLYNNTKWLNVFTCKTLEELINNFDDTYKYNINEPNEAIKTYKATIDLYDNKLNTFVKFLHNKNVLNIGIFYNSSEPDKWHRTRIIAEYINDDGKIKSKFFSTGMTCETMENIINFNNEEHAKKESIRIIKQIRNKLNLLKSRYI